MTKTTSRSPAPIRDVLYELSLAKDVPDPDLLDDFVRRYPEHAAAITDFAIELAVDSLRHDEHKDTAVDTASVSAAVSRAMSVFQNALYEKGVTQANLASQHAALTAVSDDPFVALDRPAFRKLAQELNVNTVFLCKLRDRQIDFATMTRGFLRFLANKLGIVPNALVAFFAREDRSAPRPQYFKADTKPQTGGKQSFEEAVRGSGLTEEQQRHLLGL